MKETYIQNLLKLIETLDQEQILYLLTLARKLFGSG